MILTKDYLHVPTDAEARKLMEAEAGHALKEVKDIDFEHLHPRYPRGHPRAGQFMDKPDLERYASLKPLSDLIEMRPTSRSRHEPPISEAVAAVERVLRLPDVPGSEKVKIRHYGQRSGGLRGRYTTDRHTVYVFDFEAGGRIQSFADAPGGANTVLHELGHWLDHVIVGRSTGVQADVDSYASENPDDFPSGISFAARAAIQADDRLDPAVHDAVHAWLDAVLASETMQYLQNLYDTDHITVELQDGRVLQVQPERRYIEYLSTPAEVWARTFDQYIALRSGNLDLQQYVTFFRAESVSQTISYPGYWDWQEFQPIAESLDKLFAALGWLHPEGGSAARALAGMETKEFDPIDHPRWPAGFPLGGQFMEKPHTLDTPTLRLRWGEGTMADVLDQLSQRWRPRDEREAREWGHVIKAEVEKDRGFKAALTREENAYYRAYAADDKYRNTLHLLNEAEDHMRFLREHPERYEPNEVAYVTEEYGSQIEPLRAEALDLMRKNAIEEEKWLAARDRLVTAQQNALTRVLSQIHAGFGDKRFKLTVGGGDEPVQYAHGEEPMKPPPDVQKAMKKVESVSRFLPPSWIQAMNDKGKIGVLMTNGRASHTAVPRRVSGIPVETHSVIRLAERSGESTALHEIGHRAQACFPWAAEIERQFHARRTEGEGTTQLFDPPDPEFGVELTKKDLFFDPYVGKVYPGFSEKETLPDGTVRATLEPVPREVITMGLESIWFGGPRATYSSLRPYDERATKRDSVWESDPEHAELILGLLASRP